MENISEALDRNMKADRDTNLNRKFANLHENTWNALDDLKIEKEFKSINSVVEYLLNIESSAKKQNLIEYQYTCTHCPKQIQNVSPKIASRLHRYKHFQLDPTTDCEGTPRHGYGLKFMPNGVKEHKNENNGAIEHKDEEIEQDSKQEQDQPPLFDLRL